MNWSRISWLSVVANCTFAVIVNRRVTAKSPSSSTLKRWPGRPPNSARLMAIRRSRDTARRKRFRSTSFHLMPRSPESSRKSVALRVCGAPPPARSSRQSTWLPTLPPPKVDRAGNREESPSPPTLPHWRSCHRPAHQSPVFGRRHRRSPVKRPSSSRVSVSKRREARQCRSMCSASPS